MIIRPLALVQQCVYETRSSYRSPMMNNVWTAGCFWACTKVSVRSSAVMTPEKHLKLLLQDEPLLYCPSDLSALYLTWSQDDLCHCHLGASSWYSKHRSLEGLCITMLYIPNSPQKQILIIISVFKKMITLFTLILKSLWLFVLITICVLYLYFMYCKWCTQTFSQ